MPRGTTPAPPTLARCGGPEVAGAAFISAVAAESNEELAAGMKEDWRLITMAQARIVLRQAEFDRRQAFRDDGATSLESWTAESFGVSGATARLVLAGGRQGPRTCPT